MTVCVTSVNSTTIQLKPPEGSHQYRHGNFKETQHSFRFVFPENVSQKALFDHVALPLVDDLLHGKNALLFMYGITGSGKTHTMQGTATDGGVLPRCLDVIFNSLGDLQARKYVFIPDKANGFDVQTEADAMMERQRRELMPPPTPTGRTPSTPRTPRTRRRAVDHDDLLNQVRVPDNTRVSSIDEDNNYTIFVSYIEIYNNLIYDLLEEITDTLNPAWMTPKKPDTDGPQLQTRNLREDCNHNMYVSMCTEVEVKNTEDAYAVFLKGQKRRRVAHTQLNTESSRSHSVFNVRLVQAPLDPIGEEVLQDKNEICVSQLSLVDLAGSERTSRTNSTGDRLREAGNINASLMTLRTCIETLRENQKVGINNRIVPYRDSKVTHLFKNYFDGEGKVRMMVCVNPKAQDYDETTHVMKFAEVTQEVQVARPTEIKFDVGLTPGRRRANQMYKKAIEEGGHIEDLAPIISLGPPFPCLQINDPQEQSTLENLIAYLEDKEKRRHTLREELIRKQGIFRARLMEMDGDTNHVKQENTELRMKLNSQKRSSEALEKRIKHLESQNAMLVREQQMYEHDKREMEHELTSKRNKIQKELQEKDKLRNALKGVASSQKDKWEKECEKRVRATQIELETKMWVKDEKLRQLKEIVCNREREEKARKAKVTATRNSTFNRSKSPPPKPSQPPVRLRHRRSRSTGGNTIWVDHKPTSTLKTDTFMQPVGPKKKKTVAAPSVKDIKGSDNYMLTHQEEDSKGEVETKIYKADVFETRGGGRAVQFIDVEKLRQDLPPSPPRGSSSKGSKRPADEELDSGDWTDVETRCAVGIEGKPSGHQAAVHIVPQKKQKK